MDDKPGDKAGSATDDKTGDKTGSTKDDKTNDKTGSAADSKTETGSGMDDGANAAQPSDKSGLRRAGRTWVMQPRMPEML